MINHMPIINPNSRIFVKFFVISSTLLSLGRLTANAQYSCAVPPPSTVGWWPANGNANDVVNGNNGIFTGSYANGAVGQAFNIDSAAHTVRVPAACVLNVGYGSGMTVEGWVKPNDGSYEPWVDWSTSSSYGAHIWFNFNLPGRLWINLVDTNGLDHLFPTAGNFITPNTFQHVAVTYDKMSGIAAFYLNGVLEQSTYLGSFSPKTSNDLYIGYRVPGLPYGGTYFKGLLDETSIYNAALSPIDIQAIYNAGVAGKCIPVAQGNCTTPPSNLQGWWPAESSANDLVTGNPGALNNVLFADGAVGHAFYFNGTNAYVEFTNSSALQIANQLTIEFWMKRLRMDNSHYEYIVEKGGDWYWNHQNYAVQIHAVDNTLCFTWGGPNAGTGGYRGAGSITADNTWHHCAVVVLNGAANPTFYIDGVQSTITLSGGASTINLISSSTAPLHIGAQVDPQTGFNYYSDTLIDEMSIYSRALSTAEIQSIYNAGNAGKCAPATPPPILSQLPANNMMDQRPRVDSIGKIVDAHDGMMAQFGTSFYLYGTTYGETFGLQGSASDCTYFNHYSCYRSTDLVNWTLANAALLKQRVNGQLVDPPPGLYFRPHVIYNTNTNKYILWYNWWTGYGGPSSSYLGVAQSSSPTGPFEILAHKQLLTGADFNLFVDDDPNRTGYIIYTTYPGFPIKIQQLDANYQIAISTVASIASGEAPVLFRYGTNYYTLYGNLCPFRPWGAHCYVLRCGISPGITPVSGPWVPANEINGTGPYNIPAQVTHVARVATRQATNYIWMGDLWGSGNNWANWAYQLPQAPSGGEYPYDVGDRGQDHQYWTNLVFNANSIQSLSSYQRNLVLVNKSSNAYQGPTAVVAYVVGTTTPITIGNPPPNPWPSGYAWSAPLGSLFNPGTYYDIELQDGSGHIIGEPLLINGAAFFGPSWPYVNYQNYPGDAGFPAYETPCGSISGYLWQGGGSSWTSVWNGDLGI